MGLPRHLPPADVDRVVDGAIDGSTRGLRNYAILLLLARIGLRADEVAQLSLDDIDWREGVISIRSNKSRNERRLPLAHVRPLGSLPRALQTALFFANDIPEGSPTV